MTTVEILKAARVKISKKDNWTKDAYAKSADGTHRHINMPCYEDAVCWCAWGALEDAAGGPVYPDDAAYAALRKELPAPFTCVPEFNDDMNTTHADVLKLFDRAIAAEEEKEEKKSA